MKTLILLCSLNLVLTPSFGQELYSDQSWELVGDQNSDGWVDPGDTIAFDLVVSYHNTMATSIAINNKFEDPTFKVINGSVTTTTGAVDIGNLPGDTEVSISNMHLEAPWGYATVKYQAVISVDKTEISSVSNEILLLSSFREPIISKVDIHLKPRYMEASSEPLLGHSFVLIMIILLAGVVLGIIYKQVFTPKLSY